ncbi:hypothetical protein PHAVU_007G083900 [Phaseolus vulgaris]|uniref:Uncharacterized protein n=1 Tax=Phaseolus vulgaris TaxID=3885 RepID=V7BCH7_PHAVU|nr:hypothetical protein PHAVU_007G083900g [Phaseolus vulgaris]ESW15577.1 hypothetical protein PHAVU_007G083900g [Phaseolus vulgaris]
MYFPIHQTSPWYEKTRRTLRHIRRLISCRQELPQEHGTPREPTTPPPPEPPPSPDLQTPRTSPATTALRRPGAVAQTETARCPRRRTGL